GDAEARWASRQEGAPGSERIARVRPATGRPAVAAGVLWSAAHGPERSGAMPIWSWVVIVIAIAVIAVALVAWLGMRRRRTRELRAGFGPEYDRTVQEYGDRRRAEEELQARKERVERLHIQPLAAEDRQRFMERWHATQAQFVDEPGRAIAE